MSRNSERERVATLEGKVRDTTRKGKMLGFMDTEAPSGFRGTTDAEHQARDAIRDACEFIDTDRYEAGDIAAEIIVWSDGDIETRRIHSDRECDECGGLMYELGDELICVDCSFGGIPCSCGGWISNYRGIDDHGDHVSECPDCGETFHAAASRAEWEQSRKGRP